jgi:CDP-diacylglycerol--serine O-phosphatidyltransferase
MTERSDQIDLAPRRRVRAVAVLPSLLTLGNLLCGFAAVFYASRRFTPDDPTTYVLGYWTPLTISAVLVFVGMIFDGLDGWVARLTRSFSDLGEQLDSMADMITFGLAPAFLMLQLADIGTPFVGSEKTDTYLGRTVLLIAGIYVACCALRLARFNIEASKHEDTGRSNGHDAFSGLPSPGAAGTVAAIVMLHQHHWGDHPGSAGALVTTAAMVAITLAVALAMVSRLPYSHVVNRHLRNRAPFHYIVIIVLIAALSWLQFQTSLAIGFVIYAASAPIGVVYRRIRHRPRNGDSAPTPSADADELI